MLRDAKAQFRRRSGASLQKPRPGRQTRRFDTAQTCTNVFARNVACDNDITMPDMVILFFG